MPPPVQQVSELTSLGTKDSFPRRNITNKLRNANGSQAKQKSKFVRDIGPGVSHSPLSFYNNRGEPSIAKNGLFLPNLGSAAVSTMREAP